MADEITVQKVGIDIIGNVKVDKESLKKAAEEVADVFDNGSSKVKGKGVSDEVSKTASSLGFLKDALKDTATYGWLSMKRSIQLTLAPLKSMAKSVLNTAKSFGIFFSQLKRIATYRLIRSALKEITQGFQEGIQNAYQWAVFTGNQFARSMDMMATSALYLKNSLGAMTAPLINYLAPILDHLTDQFVELINVVNRFIATITGASSWIKALKYPAEYMEQAAGSAKELKNQLLGFDDLNVLNAPKSSGSGASMDYSKMFEKVELSLKETSFTKALQEAVKNSDWEAIGELLGEYLNEMIDNINAKEISKWLGDKLNAAISLVHTLLKEFSFRNIGVKIGEFISNLQLDWAKIASVWVNWNFKIADILIGMIQSINWSNVGKALGNYVVSLFDSITAWLGSVDWIKLGSDIAGALKSMFQAINWREVGRALLELLAGMLNAVFSGLGAVGKTILKWISGDSSVQYSVDAFLDKMKTDRGTSGGGNVYIPTAGSGGGGRMYDPTLMANGGFPTQGSVFIAGESGAEFVGQIGGRTGVYNADQMANSLASANEIVVNTLVSVGNAVVGAINRKDTSVNVTDIRRALNTTNMRYGV